MSYLSSALLGCLLLVSGASAGCGASPAGDDDFQDEEGESDAARAPARSDAGSRPPSGGVRDASSTGTVRPDGGTAPSPFAPGDRTPSPDNIKECPPVAPDNPVGSCLGVPIYATCSYTTYNCICDWYHWICI